MTLKKEGFVMASDTSETRGRCCEGGSHMQFLQCDTADVQCAKFLSPSENAVIEEAADIGDT